MSSNSQPSSNPLSGTISSMDPIGNQITKWGGDPLNIYGNASPNGALFQNGAPPGNGVPSTLPNFGITQQRYNPNSFVAPSTAGGPWNAMAQALAGPRYMPTPMGPTAAPMMKKPGAPGKGGGLLGYLQSLNTAPGGNMGLR